MMSSESRIESFALAAFKVSRWHGESSERFRTGDIRFRSCTKAPENECVSRDATVEKRGEAKTGSSETWSWRWRRSFLADDVHARW